MTQKNPIRITMAQINPTVGDVAGNAEKILSVWHDHQDSSDLIIFSELCLSGYQPEDLVLHDSFLSLCQKTINKITAETKNGPALIIGAPLMNGDKRQNCALFIHDGTVKLTVAKYELPNYGVFDEIRVFQQGDLSDPINYMGYKLGIGICEDFWFPTVADNLTSKGADILISLNGSPFEVGKGEKRLSIVGARVTETSLPFIYINQYGGQDEIVYGGGSFAMRGDGKLAYHAMRFYEDIETILFPFESSIDYVAPDDMRLIYDCLKLGLKDYVDKNGFPGILLGSSGGIDSALSAAIAVDALGADRVHCIMMPSPYTSQESLDDAQSLADNLGCSHEILSIQPAIDAYNHILGNPTGVTAENIQSRARGMILMAKSNTTGNMVLSTGNKSEMAVGYATLYGDMCGGYNVLKDVYKTQVYALAKWRNEQSPVIPENIIIRPPSAELRPDQTDQDSLPDYDILDAILVGLIEKRRSVSQLVSEGFDAKTVQIIRHWLDRAEYKRRQSAPGVKITKNSFGRERRMPITNLYDNA